jgi:hypothetical protein
MAIAGSKMYFIIDTVERLLLPRGYSPITALHGGKPIRQRVMTGSGTAPASWGSGVASLARPCKWSGGGQRRAQAPPAATVRETAAATAATRRD